MKYLIANGITYGYGGLSHTVARHRRTYYATESSKIKSLLAQYRKETLISTVK